MKVFLLNLKSLHLHHGNNIKLVYFLFNVSKINDFLSSRKNSKLINEISNKYLQKVNSFEDELRSLSQDDLINKIYDLKKSYSENKIQELKELDICLICAITREVSNRTLGLRHFDSQIIGGIALYHGLIAEMKTGEGKTLVATIPIILNFILDKKVHLITVNDYLAKRDFVDGSYLSIFKYFKWIHSK